MSLLADLASLRRATLFILHLCVFAVVCAAFAADPPHAEERPPFTTREIASGIFVHEAPVALADRGNLGAVANLGFIVGRDGVAVIDTGGSLAAGRRLLASIRERTDRPILYVINTHMHPDHVLGNGAFKESGATFVGHHNLPRALADRAGTYLAANAALVGDSFEGTEIVPPTLLVEDARTLDLGDRTLRIEAWPTAHTNTDMTILDSVTDTWFLGDLLFVDHVPALDGSLAGWIRTLESLRSRTAARVVPGHGPATVEWPGGAAPMAQYLTRLQADIRSAIRQGHTISEASDQAAREEAGAWRLFKEFNPRNATTSFHELEWE